MLLVHVPLLPNRNLNVDLLIIDHVGGQNRWNCPWNAGPTVTKNQQFYHPCKPIIVDFIWSNKQWNCNLAYEYIVVAVCNKKRQWYLSKVNTGNVFIFFLFGHVQLGQNYTSLQRMLGRRNLYNYISKKVLKNFRIVKFCDHISNPYDKSNKNLCLVQWFSR